MEMLRNISSLPIDTAWAAGFVFLVLLMAGELVGRFVPFYRRECSVTAGRYAALDGLRGFLAFGVFVHHALINFFAFSGQGWNAPEAKFYEFLGPVAVSLFFMMTGFLFWRKALKGPVRPGELYWSRLWRIGPLYLFSVVMLLALVVPYSGVWPRVPVGQYLGELARIFSLGFMSIHGFNGAGTGHINASVTWTLHYEWMFYLALPLLALLLARGRVFAAFAVGFVLLEMLWPARRPPIRLDWLMFLGGMASAYVVEMPRVCKAVSGWMFSVVIVAIVAAIFVLSPVPKSFWTLGGLFVVFASIACGNSLFGILTSTGARYLGTISYSAYLLHGMVLYCVLHMVDRYAPVREMGAVEFWSVAAMCGVVMAGFGGLTYRFIEHPGIEMGRRKKVREIAPASAGTADGSDGAKEMQGASVGQG